MPKRAKIESHRFFCINCGREGIPISRSVGQLHGEFHRKKCCKGDERAGAGRLACDFRNPEYDKGLRIDRHL